MLHYTVLTIINLHSTNRRYTNPKSIKTKSDSLVKIVPKQGQIRNIYASTKKRKKNDQK